MRATEFITEEAKAAKYNGLTLKYAFNDRALIMKAFDPTKNPLAYVKFVKENDLPERDKWDLNDLVNYLRETGKKIKRLEKYFSNEQVKS